MLAGGDATSIPLSNILYHIIKTTFTSHALHHGIGNLDQLSALSLVVTFIQPTKGESRYIVLSVTLL